MKIKLDSSSQRVELKLSYLEWKQVHLGESLTFQYKFLFPIEVSILPFDGASSKGVELKMSTENKQYFSSYRFSKLQWDELGESYGKTIFTSEAGLSLTVDKFDLKKNQNGGSGYVSNKGE